MLSRDTSVLVAYLLQLMVDHYEDREPYRWAGYYSGGTLYTLSSKIASISRGMVRCRLFKAKVGIVELSHVRIIRVSKQLVEVAVGGTTRPKVEIQVHVITPTTVVEVEQVVKVGIGLLGRLWYLSRCRVVRAAGPRSARVRVCSICGKAAHGEHFVIAVLGSKRRQIELGHRRGRRIL